MVRINPQCGYDVLCPLLYLNIARTALFSAADSFFFSPLSKDLNQQQVNPFLDRSQLKMVAEQSIHLIAMEDQLLHHFE